MTLKQNRQGYSVFLITGGVTFAVFSIAGHVMAKRAKKRYAEEAFSRNAAFTHYMDQLDGVSDDLDRRIRIAKKNLLDNDFKQIIENF
jgi:hypothetical protein